MRALNFFDDLPHRSIQSAGSIHVKNNQRLFFLIGLMDFLRDKFRYSRVYSTGNFDDNEQQALIVLKYPC